MSYDFYPLQGSVTPTSGNTPPTPNWDTTAKAKSQPRVTRISTLEIAIRAQAKRFLSHPLVVQQLEAIWAGAIVFHSAADNLHRPQTKVIPNQNRGYGAIESVAPVLKACPDRLQPSKQRDHHESVVLTIRRSVTLYDPRDASLFKLSRLRVPRYRQFLSTCSFAILLGLFLAVLIERSLQITVLEIVFWFWSAGFMLDEIVGFNEQGFSLYIMSFWNAFDLGILLLLICYYCMRLYGILMPDLRKHYVADLAYDILAANAVLLFPRLFSVLDHYRYFSQLLIAFRMMAVDLVAVFVLILISCSGFFVAFTLAFGNDHDGAKAVAYALFQMLMGFTPAAWDKWEGYNLLGKGILTLFLFICHFLIVTILITVLTNSFMAIVQNANEEHQFVFAVNTISMVKSDALFSYVAPTNVIAWLLTPLRFMLPFRQFVQINRTVIKVTHFPVLFLIYAYERILLQSKVFEPTEMVEQRGRSGKKPRAFEGPSVGLNLFSPKNPRLREPSVATFHKDRALEEVFRRPFRDNTVRTTKSHERRKTSNVVTNWMQTMGPDGRASPPTEQDRAIVDKLETRRAVHRRSQILKRRGRDFSTGTMSVASDPEEFVGSKNPFRPSHLRNDSDLIDVGLADLPEQTDGDGDDELVTNDDEEDQTIDRLTVDDRSNTPKKADPVDYFTHQTPVAVAKPPDHQPTLSFAVLPEVKEQSPILYSPQRPTRRAHHRNLSTATILYNPPAPAGDSSSSPSRNATTAKNSARNTGPSSGAITPASAGRRTPKRVPPGVSRPRPVMPTRSMFQSAPNLDAVMMLDTRDKNRRRIPLAFDIGSDIGDNKAAGGGFIGTVPASFATQMGFADNMRARQDATNGDEDQKRMSRLMLGRMNALEQGFREVVNEFKDWRREDNRSTGDDRHESKTGRRPVKKTAKGNWKGKGKDEAAGQEWVDEDDGPRGEKGSSI